MGPSLMLEGAFPASREKEERECPHLHDDRFRYSNLSFKRVTELLNLIY